MADRTADGFGLENLPFGAVARPGEPARQAVRVGERALLLEPLGRADLLGDLPGRSPART